MLSGPLVFYGGRRRAEALSVNMRRYKMGVNIDCGRPLEREEERTTKARGRLTSGKRKALSQKPGIVGRRNLAWKGSDARPRARSEIWLDTVRPQS